MADVEVSQDGRAALLVADGQPAWHRLGQLKSEPVDTETGLRDSFLAGWDVHKVKIFGEKVGKRGPAGRTINFAHDFGTVRTNPFTQEFEGLGTVGKLWTPVQNEDAASFGDLVMKELGGAKWHTMGSLADGRKVFMSLKMPEGISIGGEDHIDVYLIIANAHDGKGSLLVLVSPVRVVCQNTLDMAVHEAVQRWSIRHVGDMDEKMEIVRESLSNTHDYLRVFQSTAEKMASDKYTEADMDKLLRRLIKDPESGASGWMLRAEGQRNAIMDLFKNAETNEFARGTKWAAYNAVAEYADWNRNGSPERIARETLGIDINQALKPQAFKMLVAS